MPETKSVELSAFRRDEALVITLRLWSFAVAYRLTSAMFGDLILAPFRLGCLLFFLLLLAAGCKLAGLFFG